jgi:hypothetical protein
MSKSRNPARIICVLAIAFLVGAGSLFGTRYLLIESDKQELDEYMRQCGVTDPSVGNRAVFDCAHARWDARFHFTRAEVIFHEGGITETRVVPPF